MESTSKEDDEGRTGEGKGGTEEGREGREGEKEDGSEGLCSCKNSLKYGLPPSPCPCLRAPMIIYRPTIGGKSYVLLVSCMYFLTSRADFYIIS